MNLFDIMYSAEKAREKVIQAKQDRLNNQAKIIFALIEKAIADEQYSIRLEFKPFDEIVELMTANGYIFGECLQHQISRMSFTYTQSVSWRNDNE